MAPDKMPGFSVPLLALGLDDDRQFHFLANKLQARGAKVVHIDRAQEFALDMARSGEVRILLDGHPISPAAIWVRIKFGYLARPTLVNEDYDAVSRVEWTAFEGGMSAIWPERCLHKSRGSIAHNKLAQLVLAARIGFTIPATRCGMGKEGAVEFARIHGSVVLKGLAAARITREDTIDAFITTKLTSEEIEAAEPEEFCIAPFFLQELMDNSKERRVIVFGDSVFCYAMEDVVEPLTDRRMMRPKFILTETPPGLPGLVKLFLKEAGMRYGVFDLIELDDGFAFLECNPEGQWHSANGINLNEVSEKFADWAVDEWAAV